MVKNYAARGSPWLPATVVKQTGPVSYRCQLDNGHIVKRHQNQIHLRRHGSLVDPDTEAPVDMPSNRSDNPSPDLETENPSTLNESTGAEALAPIEPPVFRRSSPVRKPVEKLNF